MTFAFPATTLVVGSLALPEMLAHYGGALAVMVLGAVSYALTLWAPARRHARMLGLGVIFLVGLAEAVGILGSETTSATPGHHMASYVTFLLLVGMAALPIKPLQTFFLGVALLGSYVGASMALHVPAALEEEGMPLLVIIGLTTFMCTALTAVMYRQRAATFEARREAELSFEELKEAQARLLVSENAASQGRFAAALSHELNTPIGSLGSAADTFARAYERIVADPTQLERVRGILLDAVGSVKESRERLDTTLERLRHVTNLDRAEAAEIDLNELWTDTAELLRPEIEARIL